MTELAGFLLGVVIATLTAPVGVSGAVFLLPAQVSLLHVPSPAVTPTNLLFNVIAVPGALARYGKTNRASRQLARQLVTGTIPGVVIGAAIRVFALPSAAVFRLVVAVFLLPLGAWLLTRRDRPRRTPRGLAPHTIRALGTVAGLVGGIYGIGGGSLLAPVLVGSGYDAAEVAPAALLSTFVTSVAGAATFAILDVAGRASAGPHWVLGLACGAGGLVGGYLGATLQPRLPAAALRALLGALAVALACFYLATAV